MPEATKYEIPKGGVKGTFSHAFYGEINYSFDAGAVTPKSEMEEFILDYLASEKESPVKRKRAS